MRSQRPSIPPRSALCVNPGVPSKSDFLELEGTNGKRQKPGREENISSQEKHTEREPDSGCAKLPGGTLSRGLSEG